MQFSIIIPTYNRLDQLRRVLDALTAQTLGPDQFEVVVVSDGSSDGTAAYLREANYPFRLVPVFQANAGPAAARNNGVRHAQAPMILFLDDDVIPVPQLLAEHARSHEIAGEKAVVIGPLATPDDFAMQQWVRWEQDRLAEQYAAMVAGHWEPTARQFYTGNASLARRHFFDLGGFDASFRRAEDVELGYRLADAGFRFVFNPDAIGYHYAVRSLASWMATPYAYGRNDVIFTRDRGQSWLLPLVEREYVTRHPLVRELVGLCLNRPWPSALATRGLCWLAIGCQAIGVGPIASAAFGALFNLRYYQGAADELRARGEQWRPGRMTLAQRGAGT